MTRKNSSLNLIFCILFVLALTLSSCVGGDGTEVTDNGTDTGSVDVTETETESATPETEPAEDLGDAIVISTAEELIKIGKNKAYPLSGDYVLTADIDLSGIEKFVPIGGAASDCGIVKGKNVFSGTFDGRGHTITGLNITTELSERAHIGLFGSVGSEDKDDPAVIKNLIIKNVSVKANAKGIATYAVLCGQASGCVEIDNISIISGKIEIDNVSGDILGIGSLVGQCRTQESTGCSNRTIHISNIFTDVDIVGDNNGGANYTSGVIGRIRGSDLGSLKNVIQLGTVKHEGGEGNAVTSGDSNVRRAENVYYLSGVGREYREIGKETSYDAFLGGKLKLDGEAWHIEEGLFPILSAAYESSAFSMLDFVSVTLSNGETYDRVESDFSLPTEVMGKSITWTSSNEKIISIENNKANVKRPEFGYEKVILTAEADGESKTYELNVFSGVLGRIEKVGDTLKAVNYPDGTAFKWVVKNPGTNKTVKTLDGKNVYTLSDKELNCMITLKAEGYDDVSYFYSNIPTVYINSDTEYYDVAKGGYSKAELFVATTDDYPETSYDNDIEIKLRGNTTAYQSKRPFRIKLDKKSDMFGMGESKHWCLLANYFDRTNLRNKLSYDLGESLGLSVCESTFVNLIYNGEYYGLYQFTETIRAAEDRVPIFNWEEEAEDVAKAIAKAEGLSKQEQDKLEEKLTENLSWITSGKFESYTISDYVDTSDYDITGGYLIENDLYYDEVSKFTTSNQMKLQLQNPEYLYTNKDMMNYLKTYIQEMENAIYSPNRQNSQGKHYSEYMDVESFIDFWMVNQVFKNVELLYKSCYMYKDVGGLLTFGPIWDMDWTSGNHVNLNYNSAKYDSWLHGESQDREYWYRALYNDPWFVLGLYERWGEIGPKIDGMMTEFDSWSEKLEGASNVDNKRWYYDWTYESEISTLKKWLSDRRGWMEEQMQSPETLIESFGYYTESEKIAFSEIMEKKNGYELTVSVADEAIASVDVLINGKVARTIDGISDGDIIKIDNGELREKGLYNSVEIIAKNASGEYLTIRKRSGQSGSSAMVADYAYIISK